MSKSATVYAEICRAPAQWELREVLADALVEEGDFEWVPYVRAVNEPDGFSPLPDKLAARLSQPFKRYRKTQVRFRYGLPHTLVLSPEDFIEHGNEILDLGPFIEVRLQHDNWTNWTAIIDAVLSTPALRRVRHLSLGYGEFELSLLTRMHRSDGMENVISLTAPSSFLATWTEDPEADVEAELWDVLLSSPRSRSMLDWGLGLKPHVLPGNNWNGNPPRTKRSIGDRYTFEEFPGGSTEQYTPMSAEDRALEQQYGYIPRLHAVNWSVTALDVMRGLGPAFPAGTSVTDAMYGVPATVEKTQFYY